MPETLNVNRTKADFGARSDLPIAVVVGAGGLSMAIAQRLGQSHRIALVSLKPDELERGQARLYDVGVVSAAIRCDITDANSVEACGQALASLGTVQAVAHVAALSPSVGDWRSVLSVNLIGAARIERALLPLMAQGGSAVFISSLAAHGPPLDPALLPIIDSPLANDLFPKLEAVILEDRTGARAYGLSKTALNRMVRRRAWDWGQRGCRIVSLSPGLIDTVMGAIEDTHSSKETKARLRQRLPLSRDGSMIEVADAVEFLLSPRASYINGVDLLVDGGLSAALQFPTR